MGTFLCIVLTFQEQKQATITCILGYVSRRWAGLQTQLNNTWARFYLRTVYTTLTQNKGARVCKTCWFYSTCHSKLFPVKMRCKSVCEPRGMLFLQCGDAGNGCEVQGTGGWVGSGSGCRLIYSIQTGCCRESSHHFPNRLQLAI